MKHSVLIILMVWVFQLNGQEINQHWVLAYETIDFSKSDFEVKENLKDIFVLRSESQGNYGVFNSISKDGKMLGFTNGNVLWDAKFEKTPNGDNLGGETFINGNYNFIAPYPGLNLGRYFFLFSMICPINRESCSLLYSLIEVNVDGSIDIVPTEKNVPIANDLTSVINLLPGKCNNYRLIVHTVNNDEFLLFEINENGLNTDPHKYATGPILTENPLFQIESRFSQFQDHLYLVSNEGNLLEYSYDRSEGTIQFNDILYESNTDGQPFLITTELSENGRFLYGLMGNNADREHPVSSSLYQFDLNSKSKAEMMNSLWEIEFEHENQYLFLNRTPQGNILLGFPLIPIDFASIDFPNQKGESMSFRPQAEEYRGIRAHSGFPYYINYAEYLGVNLDLPRDTTLCGEAEIQLSLSPDYDQYTWNGQLGTSQFSTNEEGWVHVEVDDGGCKGKDSVYVRFVDDLEVNLGTDIQLCEGQTVELKPDQAYEGAQYQWSTGAQTSSLVVSTGDEYILDVDIAGCAATDTVVVEVLDEIEVDLGEDIQICSGERVVLSDVNDREFDAYQWQDGNTGSDYEVTTSGLYTLMVQQGNCEGQDEIEVLFTEPIALDLGGDLELCEGEKMTLRPTNQDYESYTWSTGSTLTEIEISSDGTYSLTVTKNGCSATDQIEVSEVPLPMVDLGEDILLCRLEQPIELQNALHQDSYIYQWQDGDTEPSKSISEFGRYRLTAINGRCTATDEIEVKYSDANCGCFVQLPNVWAKEELAKINLKDLLPDCAQHFEIGIYDRWGNQIAIRTHQDTQLLPEHFSLNEGIYVYQIRYGENFHSLQMGEFVILE